MKWFQGGIAEAVAASKAKKAVFVVFIEGKDDQSQQVAQTLNSTEVSSRLESNKVVAIKLESDSENYTFFVQIYQLVPVPSIFFIGENGTPLEIIGNPLSPSDMATKIDSILLKANPQITHSSADLIDTEKNAHSSSSNEETNKPQENISTEPATSGVNQTPKDLVSNSESSGSTSSTQKCAEAELSQEEKVRRAKKLIELQQKKKAEEEERKEREREIERRRSGRDIQKLKQQQQDREIKEAQEERLKEKAAEAAARERVLKQIAEDKLERKRKHEMHMQGKAEQQKAQVEAQARAQAARTIDMSKARIQFKLPTGSNITGTFEATNTLGTLRTYVTENAQLPFRQFSMSSFFPRKDFASTDDNKTLLELELVPSAVILILPVKSSNPASVIKSADGAGIFSYFFWTLLAPVVSIYNYVMGYFTGRPRGGNNSNSNGNNAGSALGGNANLAFGRVGNMGMRRIGGQGVSKIRSRGNIHSLRSGDNDDDENNTWNGNSTQQM